MKQQKLLSDVPKRVEIINVPISAVNMEEAINFTIDNLENIRGEYICASNVHTTVMAHENKEFLEVQKNSIMSIPDGKPLSVVGRKKGYKNMDKVSGPNYMYRILSHEKLKNKNHYFYGSTKETIEEAIENVKKTYKNINICGYEPSVFRELTDEELNELCKKINNSKADFLWIGLGAPRQEKLMARMKGKVNCVMTGVGGAFNILAGKVNDAPMWMQNAGLEWFYRLIKEPKRLFKRYFVTNTKFIWYLLMKR